MLQATRSAMSECSLADTHSPSRNASSPRSGFAVPTAFPQLGTGPSPNHLAPCPLVRKLGDFVLLNEDEIAAIAELSSAPIPYRSGQILVHEGDAADYIYMLTQGMGCRYKLLPSGERQILGYIIPTDLCGIRLGALRRSDHSVALLSDSLLVKVPMWRMLDLLRRFPKVERALALSALLDVAILREWLLNIGQRNAYQKLCHFFCEMSVRLHSVGQVHDDGSFDMPINQSALADTTGLTCVHVNRTLQRLRHEGLIALRHRRLTILDFDRLATNAGFDDDYLRSEACAA